MNVLKRYRFFLLSLVAVGVLFLIQQNLGYKALTITGSSLKEMAYILPPIFVLLGLLDVWVPRETMARFMGEGSGAKGVILAFILGSAAAGPLYAAFPIAAVFMKKGVKFSNILIFIGAWSTTKIPMLLFEMSALGVKFAVTRLLVDIVGIVIIARFISRLVTQEQVTKLYAQIDAI